MKKIFVLTGEPSGDKLASKVIAKLKSSRSDIEYLSVGGEHLRAMGIRSLYELNEITYLGFTKVFLNLFKIQKKINLTANKILEFDPDILFSVDSPDFTLRVAERVKKKNSNIKTIHYVAPQVWVWREGRAKKIKKYIDHILLLFYFEKKFFDKENIKSTFVGHPLLDAEKENKVDLSFLTDKNKKIISIFPGSRLSEINTLLPILIKFIDLMSQKYNNFLYVFHTNNENRNLILETLKKAKINYSEVICDESIKKNVLSKSFFAVAKSGTISLEICNSGIPFITIYKMNFINFFIIKRLVKIKHVNIINIINRTAIIPELLQSKCNPETIFQTVESFVNNSELRKEQVLNYQKTLDEIKLKTSSSETVAKILNKEL